MFQAMTNFWADQAGASAVDFATIGALAAVGLFGVVDIMGQDAAVGLASEPALGGAAGAGSDVFDCGVVCGGAD